MNENFDDCYIDEDLDDINYIEAASPDFRTELAKQLAEIAPEAIADGKVDFEKLKELLGDDVSTTPERFGLFWPGKREAIRIAQTPTTATLKPDFENSVDWDTTENVFIEGDNLEVLKILQRHYYGKIKMIYIDPPYNTGKDFVYRDDYRDSVSHYLEWTKQVNAEGKKLSSNAQSEGRYHSNWLNMMYPRLKLARNLLTQDGVVFISIDDSEQSLLKRMTDEIFGEENFIAQIVWEKVHTRKNSARQFSVSHDYILVYARRKINKNGDGGFQRALLPRENTDAYTNPDNDPQGPWKADPIYANNPYEADYVIKKPNGVVLTRPSGQYWRYSKETIDRAIESGAILWGKGDSMPMLKRYLADVQDGLVPTTLFTREFAGDNSEGKSELKSLFEGKPLFSYPKPTRLLKRLIQIAGVSSNDIVLDFFAGSSSTASAVLDLNRSDGGHRSFIMVQLPEPVSVKSEAYTLGFRNIAEISRERIRRFGVEILAESSKLDVGFRTYRLIDSNIKKWISSNDILEADLKNHLLDIERSAKDAVTIDEFLTELLLKYGLSLTEEIGDVEISGLPLKAIHESSGGGGSLYWPTWISTGLLRSNSCGK